MFIKLKDTPDAEADRIVKQLENAVGKGNFEVISSSDIVDEINIDLDDPLRGYGALESAERRKLFLESTNKNLKNSTAGENKRLMILTDSIYILDVCDEQAVDNLIDSWNVERVIEISEEEYTTESLGVNPDCLITDEDIKRFEEIYLLLYENPKKAAKLLDALRVTWGNIPFICYLELKCLEAMKAKEYNHKLAAYSALYPDYSLIKLCAYISITFKQEDKSKTQLVNFEDIFRSRSSITNFEMFDFQSKKLVGIMARKNLNELNAMNSDIENIELNEMYFEYLKTMLLMTRISLLKEYFANN